MRTRSRDRSRRTEFHDQLEHDVVRRLEHRGHELPVAQERAGIVSRLAERRGELAQPLGLRVAAPLGGQTRGLDQQQLAGLEQRADDVQVGRAQRGQRLEPARRAPVEHTHRVAVTDLDEAKLLEPRDGLANRGEVDVELRGEHALCRQALAGSVATRQDRFTELVEHEVGDRGADDGRH